MNTNAFILFFIAINSIPLKILAQDGFVLEELEAEKGTLQGIFVASDGEGFSGSGYVTGFDDESDFVEVTYHADSRALLQLVIRYRSPSGAKFQDLIINEGNRYPIYFERSDVGDFIEADAGKYLFEMGENKIKIQSDWGYMDIDQLIVKEVVPNEFNVAMNPVDPLVDAKTREVYDFLVANFEKVTISGQTDDTYERIASITGYQPLLRSYDLVSFTEGYPYGWADGDYAFQAKDDGQVDDAIAWYEQTGQQGLVNIHWHWCSPSGGSPGVNTFWTDYTNFDVSLAVIPGTTEYDEIIRDIDAIAVQLLKLQDAKVPVIWRPLHEAGGAWFWWGAKGPEPCLALYDILYNRLQNYHGLHNLIWVWSTPEEDWYPGNDKVDILGYDSYPGEYNYIPQKQMFDQLYSISEGKKMLAMTENGPIPDINVCYEVEAPWLYFMSWAALVFSQNEANHIVDMYNHHQVMSFNSSFEMVLPPYAEGVLGLSGDDPNWAYPNPTNGLLYFNNRHFQQITLIDLQGREVYREEYPGEYSDFSYQKEGVYYLRAVYSGGTRHLKVVIEK